MSSVNSASARQSKHVRGSGGPHILRNSASTQRWREWQAHSLSSFLPPSARSDSWPVGRFAHYWACSKLLYMYVAPKIAFIFSRDSAAMLCGSNKLTWRALASWVWCRHIPQPPACFLFYLILFKRFGLHFCFYFIIIFLSKHLSAQLMNLNFIIVKLIYIIFLLFMHNLWT